MKKVIFMFLALSAGTAAFAQGSVSIGVKGAMPISKVYGDIKFGDFYSAGIGGWGEYSIGLASGIEAFGNLGYTYFFGKKGNSGSVSFDSESGVSTTESSTDSAIFMGLVGAKYFFTEQFGIGVGVGYGSISDPSSSSSGSDGGFAYAPVATFRVSKFSVNLSYEAMSVKVGDANLNYGYIGLGLGYKLY
jgi:hypothetical protein